MVLEYVCSTAGTKLWRYLEKVIEILVQLRLCATHKNSKQTTSRDLFRVARTAGQFGIFCACWIVLAKDFFYLGESLSQSWGFLIKLMYAFPQKLEPIAQYFLGYDNACQFNDFLC